MALLLLSGCGGGDRKSRASNEHQKQRQEPSAADRGGEAAGERGEEQKGLSAIPAADREAFVQIAAAISDLRTGASVLLVKGVARPRDRIVLRRVRPRVSALRPRDRRLRRLRLEVLDAIDRAIRVRREAQPARHLGFTLLADSRTLIDALRRYQRARPAIGALVPD
jgi:hypothetical protein